MFSKIFTLGLAATLCSTAFGLEKAYGRPEIVDPQAKAVPGAQGASTTAVDKTETSISYALSDRPTHYITKVETETAVITRWVGGGGSGGDGDCGGVNCSTIVELEIGFTGGEPEHLHYAIMKFVEALDVVACSGPTCNEVEPLQLVDYYSNPATSCKNETYTLILTICDEQCAEAFIKILGSRGFQELLKKAWDDLTGGADFPIYISGCSISINGQPPVTCEEVAADIGGCTGSIDGCLATKCFTSGEICIQCDAGMIQLPPLLNTCVNKTAQPISPGCTSDKLYCNYESILEGDYILDPNERPIGSCPVGFCCVDEPADPDSDVNFSPCDVVCPTPTPGVFP